jgi:hypothetical protein
MFYLKQWQHCRCLTEGLIGIFDSGGWSAVFRCLRRYGFDSIPIHVRFVTKSTIFEARYYVGYLYRSLCYKRNFISPAQHNLHILSSCPFLRAKHFGSPKCYMSLLSPDFIVI